MAVILFLLSTVSVAWSLLNDPRSYNTSWEPRRMTVVMKLIEEATIECMIEGTCPNNRPSIINNPQPCTDGMSNNYYPCKEIDLLAYLNLIDLGSSSNALGNDIWGWKDTITNRLYVLTGQTDGSSIIDVTNPTNPEVLAFIPSTLSHFVNWRDMKIFNNGWAFVVADGSNHGIQFFNMRTMIETARKYRALYGHDLDDNVSKIYRARDGVDFSTDRSVGNVHNVAINEETGFLYIVGSTQTGNSQNSRGGLVMYDVASPVIGDELKLVGTFPDDGYTHDAECVVYRGPDEVYVGREICFGYNENTLTIVDVSNKQEPAMINRTGYDGASYTHQGWLTPNMDYLLMDDELDEQRGTVTKTTTYIWDVRDLDNPVMGGVHEGPTTSIDHNLYIVENRAYEANYRAGLRILDTSRIDQFILEELAYFDVYPEDDNAAFGHGIWSVYPFWMTDENPDYHFVAIQTKDEGFMVLKPPKHPSQKKSD